MLEKSRDPWGKALEILGHYNPRTKEKALAVDKERVKYWIEKGAQASNTVHNLLIREGIISDKKKKSVRVSKKRSAKKAEKDKAKEEAVAAAEEKAKAESETPTEAPVEKETPKETPKEEPPKEESKEEAELTTDEASTGNPEKKITEEEKEEPKDKDTKQ